MAWIGYYEYAGTEIINVARTEAYAKWANLGWFKPVYRNDDLGPLLDETYTSPLQDDAPWTDPYMPESYGFYGVYPLDQTGIENSTRNSNVVESTLDGGVVGRTRFTTKAVVFNVALLGQDECSVEAGFRWLKTALVGDACVGRSDSTCGGSDLCFLSCNPCIPDDCTDLTGCLDQYRRSLRNLTFTNGPTITAKHEMVDGSVAWVATFTAVAGNPFVFGSMVPVVEGFMDPKVEVPYFGGVVPDGGSFNTVGLPYDEVVCPEPTYQPVIDDQCAFLSPPPTVPSIKLNCFNLPANGRRRQFVVPEQYIPVWGDVVPYFEFHARVGEVRNLRVRLYADYLNTGDPDLDPCAYCGDFVVSYIPLGATLVFDGSDRITYVISKGGLRQRSEHLVFGSDGKPFAWPELTCGTSYIVTFDTDQTQVPPVVDMGLYMRVL